MNPDEYQKLLRQTNESIRQGSEMLKNIDDGPIGAYLKAVEWLVEHPTTFWIIIIGYACINIMRRININFTIKYMRRRISRVNTFYQRL